MAEIMETVMLICFGFSWPMSLWKNIRAQTAKSMSLGFILLITAGYIAGIAAKICTRKFSYVLLAYILNLLMVSANLIVYFINTNKDKKGQVIK